MKLLRVIKKKIIKSIGQRHPMVLFYHKVKGFLAVFVYGNPSNKLKVIGITGTNGKTTSVNMIADLLTQAGFKVGMLSTLRYMVGDDVWSNRDKMTTQSPWFVQKMLKRMVREECDYAILEVTSHAMDQNRVYGINFDIVAITNLTGDHIEYHGTFEEYKKAKGKLFSRLFSSRRKSNTSKTIILNADDEYFEYYDQFKSDQKFAFGLKDGAVKAVELDLRSDKSFYTLRIPNDSIRIETQMLGDFNVYNSLLAISVAISQGVNLQSIAEAMKYVSPVGGRFEPVKVGQDFAVVVDYAHTADALENLCAMFKPLTAGKLIVVFGATGGGRDKRKRPEMGKAADKYADIIVLTDDDPYTEDRWGIIENIAAGIQREEGDSLYKIIDRTDAVHMALSLAETGDTVLIAGKGGEEVIVIGEEKIPYDDREVVRHYLSEKIYKPID